MMGKWRLNRSLTAVITAVTFCEPLQKHAQGQMNSNIAAYTAQILFALDCPCHASSMVPLVPKKSRDYRMHRLHRQTNHCYSSTSICLCCVTAAAARCLMSPLQLMRLEAVVCTLHCDRHVWRSTYKQTDVFTVMTE